MLLTANDKDGGDTAGRSWHRPWPYTVPLALLVGKNLWTAVPTSVLQRGVSGHTHTHPLCRPGRWQRTCRGFASS